MPATADATVLASSQAGFHCNVSFAHAEFASHVKDTSKRLTRWLYLVHLWLRKGLNPGTSPQDKAVYGAPYGHGACFDLGGQCLSTMARRIDQQLMAESELLWHEFWRKHDKGNEQF